MEWGESASVITDKFGERVMSYHLGQRASRLEARWAHLFCRTHGLPSAQETSCRPPPPNILRKLAIDGCGVKVVSSLGAFGCHAIEGASVALQVYIPAGAWSSASLCFCSCRSCVRAPLLRTHPCASHNARCGNVPAAPAAKVEAFPIELACLHCVVLFSYRPACVGIWVHK